MTLESSSQVGHQPVLLKEVLEALAPTSGAYYLDGTLGAGGHAFAMLEASSPDGKLIGLDVDPQAISIAEKKLADFGERVIIDLASYTQMDQVHKKHRWPLLDGILLDLGASSMQMDQAERGFSFRKSGPLDMRFDPQGALSASTLVNEWPQSDLAELIREFGEEPRARRIAQAIVQSRPIRNTKELAGIIARSTRAKRKMIHPATRTFQAIRIAINAELDNLRLVLPIALALLKSGGRLAVVSFHSLEDRIVKQFFRQESKDCICPPEKLICDCNHKARLKIITKKPIRPEENETKSNRRARSSKLRIAQKI